MNRDLSRREFFRAAGGITFLALVPAGRGLFAARAPLKPLSIPLFTALPYIQPGPEGRISPTEETVRVAWQTLMREATFTAEVGRDENYGTAGKIERASRSYDVGKGEADSRYNYVVSFPHLLAGTEYRYRVRCNAETIIEGYFTTRQPRGQKVRFVAFGDNSFGEVSDRAIAYQAYRARPDFIMNTGDNVYEGGLDNEYARHFFPVYNADAAGPRLGAPLLRSVPFYTVLANHDVHAKTTDGAGVCADFDAEIDSLAYYTNFHFPLNGPQPAHPTVMRGDRARLDNFKKCAGARFPHMANYSFDYGDAHFLCLDSNVYIDPTRKELQDWVTQDLAATDARWRFVVYHHPAFNVGENHFREQQMRALCPIFEKYSVDFTLSGHEHNYQRTLPLRFKPRDLAKAAAVQSKDRLIPGEITLDQEFDGENSVRPQGIIHITSGAGGKHLYDATYNNNPAKWVVAADEKVPYVANMITDRHSLTVFDLDGPELLMRQIDERGNEIDRLRVTKL